MQQKCDLYLCDPTQSDRLKFITLFDNNFLFESERAYVGYLGISVDRVKLVSVVTDLRKNGIACFSAPVIYRQQGKLSQESAAALAREFCKSLGGSVVPLGRKSATCPPVYWVFDLIYEDIEEEKAGGIMMIDRIDGHLWTQSENEVYMYDFNNVL
ncbi:hypothetical protein [Herbaspirillum camelliae]|uniref:hypothetical protein n=1 Tax=Herbaspirillum camelliae TaxID=1892903 RepID=UPI00117BDE61|nr:hypothetical protein [Herbaspirillum camelliae]